MRLACSMLYVLTLLGCQVIFAAKVIRSATAFDICSVFFAHNWGCMCVLSARWTYWSVNEPNSLATEKGFGQNYDETA